MIDSYRLLGRFRPSHSSDLPVGPVIACSGHRPQVIGGIPALQRASEVVTLGVLGPLRIVHQSSYLCPAVSAAAAGIYIVIADGSGHKCEACAEAEAVAGLGVQTGVGILLCPVHSRVVGYPWVLLMEGIPEQLEAFPELLLLCHGGIRILLHEGQGLAISIQEGARLLTQPVSFSGKALSFSVNGSNSAIVIYSFKMINI